jgi:signal transduction histidine kinase
MLLEDARDAGADADAADLEKIHSAGHHLLKLVNEVLDLSKIEAGKMELSPETLDVASFLAEVADGHREAAVAAGNALSVHADRRLGTIVADSKKLRQAVAQILDNAVKFTLGGRIDLSAKREIGARGEEIVIRVRDTGIGIAPDALPTLFDKFSVADDASATKYGGTGLGLALALRLCRLMGGDIAAESQMGSGSCFTLRIPTTPPTAAKPADDALATAA